MTDNMVFEDIFEDMDQEVVTDESQTKVVFKNDSIVCKQITDEELESLYDSFDINSDQINKKWRLDVIHIRGVQDMSSEDILKYFDDFETKSIEWVNDLSCNVVFTDPKASAVALKSLTTGLIFKSNSLIPTEGLAFDVIDAESLSVPIPPPFRWGLGVTHSKSKALLLRFATNSDKRVVVTNPKSRFCDRKTSNNPLIVRKPKRNIEEEFEIKAKRFRMRADEEQQRIQQRVAPKSVTKMPTNELPPENSGRKSIWDRLDRLENDSIDNYPPIDSQVIRISIDNSNNSRKSLLSENPLRSTISVVNRNRSAVGRTHKDIRSRIGVKKF